VENSQQQAANTTELASDERIRRVIKPMSNHQIPIRIAIFLIALLIMTSAIGSYAQTTATVRGRVEVAGRVSGKSKYTSIPETVIWLTPLSSAPGESASAPPAAPAPPNLRLVQKNKSFDPHILVVPAGSMVEFPNRDPFFHNVFSLFEGKRFDLGLYEAGTSRMVRFDRPGISYIFCNIHPEMSAVVITIATPFYAISNSEGQLNLASVPLGRYLLHIWSEGMGPENAQPLTREVTIAESASSLGVIRVPETTGLSMAHKNKYGREYDEPTPDSSVYEQQH
jgi:plastocyanin